MFYTLTRSNNYRRNKIIEIIEETKTIPTSFNEKIPL